MGYPIEQLQGVLNQLAHTSNLGAEAAANAWAGLTTGPSTEGGPAPTALSLVGALNVKAGNGSNPSKWSGLRAVCNQLAGLTPGLNDLDPLGALEHLAGNKTW